MDVRSNRIGDIRSYYKSVLTKFYDERDSDTLLFMVLEGYTELSRAKILAEPERTVSESQLLKIHFAVKDLKNYKPVQYIIGQTEFYDLKFIVTPDVLIPRPETEELVESIAKDSRNSGRMSILDIGTGSGCIAVSLKKNLPQATIHALDNSARALEIAKENARLNRTEISFFKLDFLNGKEWVHLEDYDVIVSNPPYVRHSEKKTMKKNVLDYEPESALFVSDEDPLVFYRAITKFGAEHLITGGKIYCEINQYLADETFQMFEIAGYTGIEISKDLFGNKRILKAALVK